MRAAWLRVAAGVLGALGWGLFFDQLVRVGRWALDTGYDPNFYPLEDLRFRYLEAHVAIVHGALYPAVTSKSLSVDLDTYPPIVAYLFAPFHLIGLVATEVVWTVGSVGLLAVLAALCLRRWFHVDGPRAMLWSGLAIAPGLIFALYPLRAMLVLGQIGVVLLFMTFVDLFVLPARLRGTLIGVATAIKLVPALFVVWFLAKRDVASALRCAASFVLLTLLAAVLFPHASSEFWLHLVPSGKLLQREVDQRQLPVTAATWYQGVGTLLNDSLRGLLGRPPFDWFATSPWVELDVVVLAAGIFSAVRFVRAGRELTAFVVLSLLTAMCAPVAWNHDWVFVGLVPFLALIEWQRDRPLAITALVMAAATCVNLGSVQQETFPGTPGILVFVIRNLYVLGGLVFLARAVWSAAAAPASDATSAALSPATASPRPTG